MKTKVVYFGYLDSYGHTYPALGVLEQLMQRGHDIIMYSDQRFNKLTDSLVKSFHPYPSYVNLFSDKKEYDDFFKKWCMSILAAYKMNQYMTERLYQEVANINPDYIIYDSSAIWGEEIAKKLKKPYISFKTSYAFTMEMFIENEQYLLNEYFSLRDIDNSQKYKLLKQLNRALSSYQNKYGNPSNLYDFFTRKGELTIAFFLKEFQLTSSSFDNSYAFVGPSIYSKREYVDEEITTFLDDRPCILISLGTLHNNRKDLYIQFIEFAKHSEYPVVLAIGESCWSFFKNRKFDNILIKPFVPLTNLLKNAKILITHGGTNSVMEAIYNKVPMIAIPQLCDEFLYADKIQELGIGTRIYSENVTVSSLSNICKKILFDMQVVSNIAEMKLKTLDAGGAQKATERILEYLVYKEII